MQSGIPMEMDMSLSEFPLFERGNPIRFVLEQGEILHGAPRWWHVTRALTPSIAWSSAPQMGPFRRRSRNRRSCVRGSTPSGICGRWPCA